MRLAIFTYIKKYTPGYKEQAFPNISGWNRIYILHIYTYTYISTHTYIHIYE